MPFLPVRLETASQAPRSVQTGPCRPFLCSRLRLAQSVPSCLLSPLPTRPTSPFSVCELCSGVISKVTVSILETKAEERPFSSEVSF